MRALTSLDRSLRQRGSALVVRVGTWEQQLPALAAEMGAAAVVAEAEVEAGEHVVWHQGRCCCAVALLRWQLERGTSCKFALGQEGIAREPGWPPSAPTHAHTQDTAFCRTPSLNRMAPVARHWLTDATLLAINRRPGIGLLVHHRWASISLLLTSPR